MKRVPIQVLRPTPSVGVSWHQLGRQQPHARDVAVLGFEFTDPVTLHIGHLNRVGTPDRTELARPDRRPVAGLYPEGRIKRLHTFDLRRDGRRCGHFGGSDP